MPQPWFLPLSIVTGGRDDPETVKLTISIAIQSAAGLKEESSLGAIPGMLYYNSEWSERSPDTPVKAHAGMKWFRSNIRLMSRLALFALAIQFLLSFGHFHGSSGQAAPALADAKQWALHDAVSFATTHASNRASHEGASRAVPSRTSSDHESDGQPTDGCAICAVLALADALTIATPHYLPGPQPAAFLYLIADAGSTHLNSAGIAFQPRAPPFSG